MREAEYASLEDAVRDLQVADILLVHSRKGGLVKSIRKASRSYWNHNALVFQVIPQPGALPEVLIVEALDHGIEIHRLQKYLRDPDDHVLGIKRVPDLTPEERARILSFFLEMIDTPYDFTRLLGLFLHRLVLRIAGVKVHDYIGQRLIDVDNFVCSTFAQRAFYMGVAPNKRDRVIFRGSHGSNFLYQMEFISPGDIARSDNAEWIYNPHD